MTDEESKEFIKGYNRAVRDILKSLNSDYYGMISDESMKIYQIIEFVDNFYKEGEQE